MKLSISLEPGQWQAVIAALAEAPWKVAAPLINEIQRQFTAQAAPARVMNGAAEEPVHGEGHGKAE